MRSHTLLIGKAGTGKSHACLQRYIAATKRGFSTEVIFLLPSRRAILNLENNMRALAGSQAVFTGNLLTFGDLAEAIAKKAGIVPPRLVPATRKLFVIKEITSKAKIQFFKDSARYPGFLKMLADSFRELGQALCSPGHLQKALETLSTSTPEKRSTFEKGKETYLLYDMYRKELQKLNAIDEEMLLEKAVNLLESNPKTFFTQKLLIVDGFAHYTRAQLKVLEQLLKRTPEALVTLCYQKGDPERFAFVDQTYADLMKISSWKVNILDQNRRTSIRELHHIDQLLFKAEGETMSLSAATRFIEGRDKYDEVEKIAAEILHLHLDENVPFERIGILLRSIDDYGEHIENTFRRFGIPCAIQARINRQASGPIRFLLDICRLVSGEITTERLLPVLKQGLLNLDVDNVDSLQEFVAARGIRSEADWRERWTPDASEAIVEMKEKLLKVLTPLQQSASHPRSAEEYADLIFDLLRQFEIAENIVEVERASADKSREHIISSAGAGVKTIHSACADVVNYCHLSGRTKLGFGGFAEMLQIAIENTDTRPASTANAVQISNVFETRAPEYRVVFLPNLVEKSFPRQVRDNPFLKDRERDLLRSAEFDLPLKWQRASEERYLFYIACTRASERLHFSYPLTDDRGRANKRSNYLDEVEKLFNNSKRAERLERTLSEIKSLFKKRDAYNLTARSFWTRSLDSAENAARSTIATEIYNSKILSNHVLSDVLLYGDRHGYDEKGPELSENTKKEIRNSDNTYVVSVTDLESFAICPFKYFCKKILRLEEPDICEFKDREAGTAIHDAMQSLYRQVYKEKKIFPDDLQAIVEMGLTLFRDFVRRRYRRILSSPKTQVEVRKSERLFREFLECEVEFQNHNQTNPTHFELSFQPGQPHRDADPRSSSTGLEIEYPEGIRAVLSGRMDRVDILDGDGEKYGVVIDYKNSNVTERVKFEDGTDLQVLVYLHALDKIFGIKPAAGFYYGIKSKRKRGIFDNSFKEKVCAEIKKTQTIIDTYKNDGRTEEDLLGTIERTLDKVKEFILGIHNGEIGLGKEHPRECEWCPYEKICRK